jgi:predicted Fe-Mo cluster-binding NifX family protein
METKAITIAIATDDGKTISSHFGDARYFEVVLIKNNSVFSRERRDSPHADTRETHRLGDGKHHGGHRWMASTIEGISTVVARGMGESAACNLQSLGIEPILTELRTIDEAVDAVLNNTLIHRVERIHQRKNVEPDKNIPSKT